MTNGSAVLPNFVIAGCPKCGTTAVYEWLRRHPDAATPQVKEPFYLRDRDYLGDPATERRRDSFLDAGLEGYVDIFRPTIGARLRFEATTHYFYQRVAPEVLLELATHPKILVMIRQPSDRLYSWYSFNRNHLASFSPELAFSDVVDAVLGGHPERLRRHCRYESTYRSFRDGVLHGEYSRFLTPWLEFGLGSRLRVEVLEDVAGNERSFVQSLAEWLGLDPEFYRDSELPTAGVGYRTRFPRVHYVARAVARHLRGGGAARKLLVRGYRKLQQADRRSRLRSDSDRAALRRLDAHYVELTATLAAELGRPDLPELWRRER